MIVLHISTLVCLYLYVNAFFFNWTPQLFASARWVDLLNSVHRKESFHSQESDTSIWSEYIFRPLGRHRHAFCDLTLSSTKNVTALLSLFVIKCENSKNRIKYIAGGKGEQFTGRRKVSTVSQVLSSIQHICYRKTSGSNMGVPNLLLAPGAI